MAKKLFLARVLQMAAGFLIFNISGIFYNIFMSRKMGAEGAGLFHLIMNVYSIGVSLSVSGMSLTCTRLLSDRPLEKGLSEAGDIIKKCMRVCIFTSLFASFVLFIFADFIALLLVGKAECGVGIRILAPSLICVGISSVLGGYFTAFAKVGAYSVGQALAEVVSWMLTLFLMRFFPSEKIYLAVIISTCASVLVRTLSDIFLYFISSKNVISKKSSAGMRDVFNLCTPLALGSYLRTGLSGAENFLIPKRLKAGNFQNPLKIYGTIKGMAMPVVMFPAVFISAFTSLLVPEIARKHSGGYKNSVRYISSLSIEYVLKFAILVWGILFFYGKNITGYFFGSVAAGQYLHLLCALPLFLYTDSVCDAILKGMDDQIFSLKLNAIDSVLRNIVIFFLLPLFGGWGYIILLYVSEIFNLSISFWRMKKKTALPFPGGKAVIVPVLCVFLSRVASKYIFHTSVLTEILIFSGLYIALSEMLSVPISQSAGAESDGRQEPA